MKRYGKEIQCSHKHLRQRSDVLPTDQQAYSNPFWSSFMQILPFGHGPYTLAVHACLRSHLCSQRIFCCLMACTNTGLHISKRSDNVIPP